MKRTVLIIDDDELCRAPAAAMLRAENWNVVEAENGEHGFRLAVEYMPDVILCDLLMPRGNGFHLCRAVREHFELRHTKIVVLSGRDYPSDRESAAEVGADGYLLKPLNMALFNETLASIGPLAHANARSTDNGADTKWASPGDGVQIKFWGVRGSIPTPGPTTVHFGGNTSCVEVRADGEFIILDAGTGIRPLGQSLAAEFGDQALQLTVLISHTHWDHIQGFPFFLPAYSPRNRLRILGYEGARASLAATLAGQMESPYFPIALKQMPGNIVIEELREMSCQIGRVRVEACFSNHPGVCVGYRLFTSAGSIVYLPDNELPIAASKDGACAMEKNLLGLIHGADLLICDSQYERSEYSSHVGWGHACVDDVISLAIKGEVKEVYLFHHDPAHDDTFLTKMLAGAQKMAREQGSNLRVRAAREGESVAMKPAAQ